MAKTHQQLHRAEREMFLQFYRNGRWGSCVECPRDADNNAYPEFCLQTDRRDHQLTGKDLVEAYENRLK